MWFAIRFPCSFRDITIISAQMNVGVLIVISVNTAPSLHPEFSPVENITRKNGKLTIFAASKVRPTKKPFGNFPRRKDYLLNSNTPPDGPSRTCVIGDPIPNESKKFNLNNSLRILTARLPQFSNSLISCLRS